MQTLLLFSVFPTHFLSLKALEISNVSPKNLPNFLNYATDRIILRRVGGGYMFIHRLLLEHFANMTDEDIERLANEIEQRKSGG